MPGPTYNLDLAWNLACSWNVSHPKWYACACRMRQWSEWRWVWPQWPFDMAANRSICGCSSQDPRLTHTGCRMRCQPPAIRLAELPLYCCDWTMTVSPEVCTVVNSFRMRLTIDVNCIVMRNACHFVRARKMKGKIEKQTLASMISSLNFYWQGSHTDLQHIDFKFTTLTMTQLLASSFYSTKIVKSQTQNKKSIGFGSLMCERFHLFKWVRQRANSWGTPPHK